MDDLAIKVEHVSKKYCKSLNRSMIYGVTDISRNTLGLSSHPEKLRKEEFWAINDISFELRKGKTLGIIGPNGSGKTTLLKMLNGIFWPDKGKITIKGRVGALIEVGAGFHPLLTGRENIYVNGAILGMSKQEIDNKFDNIVDFADIGDFLDTPVKFYSSGMFVKLGFAIAVHCEPEVLLIDEILSVGDISFQNKCLNKIAKMRNNKKTTIILVSHNMNTIQLMADRCVFLYHGKLMKMGQTAEVVDEYFKCLFSHNNDNGNETNNLKVEILGQDNGALEPIVSQKKYTFRFTVNELFIKRGFLFAFSFVNLTHNFSYRVEIKDFLSKKGALNDFSFNVVFEKLSLPPGEYAIRFAVSDGDFLNRIYYRDRIIIFRIGETVNDKYLNPQITIND